MEKQDKEIKLIDMQMFFTFLTAIPLFIALFLLYNERRTLTGNPVVSKEQAYQISLASKTLLFLLSLGFVYISWYVEHSEFAEGKNEKDLEIQTITAVLAAIAAGMILYSVIANKEEDLFTNPLA